MATRTEYICDNCGDVSQDLKFLKAYSASHLSDNHGSLCDEHGNSVRAELCDRCAYSAVVHALNGKRFVPGPAGAVADVPICRNCGRPKNDHHHCNGIMFVG